MEERNNMQCRAKTFSSGPTVSCEAEAEYECIDSRNRDWRTYLCEEHREMNKARPFNLYDPDTHTDFYELDGRWARPLHLAHEGATI